MWFLILGHDVPGSLERRMAVRAEHLARLKLLQEAGRIKLAGPMPFSETGDITAGVRGSAIVAEFVDLAAARAWVDADPYVTAQVYQRVDIFPFIPVLP